MSTALNRPVSGHVFRADRRAGRFGTQVPVARRAPGAEELGLAWRQRGRPTAGYFTKRTAQAWLDETLATARRGELVGMVRTGTTFSVAAEEWLRYVEQERACKPSTVTDYRNMTRILVETFGDELIEDVTTESIEHWKAAFTKQRRLSNRTLQKYLVTLHGIFKRGGGHPSGRARYATDLHVKRSEERIDLRIIRRSGVVPVVVSVVVGFDPLKRC